MGSLFNQGVIMFGILDITQVNEANGSNSQVIAQFAADLTISSARVIAKSDSLSLSRITSSTPSQRWEVEARIFDTEYFVDFFVHNIINDANTKIYIRPPMPVKKTSDQKLVSPDITAEPALLKDHQGFIWSRGSGSVQSEETKGSNSLAIGAQNSTNTVLAKGDFIQFTDTTPGYDHDKMYLVTRVTPATGGNDPESRGNISIFPALQQDVPAARVIKFGKNVAMKCYYDMDNAAGMEYEDGILVRAPRVKFVEAI